MLVECLPYGWYNTTALFQVLVWIKLWSFLQRVWITASPTGIYLFKVNAEDTRLMYEICSKLIIKTTDRRHWHRSGVFVKFEQILHIVLVFPLLTFNNYMSTLPPTEANIWWDKGAQQTWWIILSCPVKVCKEASWFGSH